MKKYFLSIIFLIGVLSCEQLNQPSKSFKYSIIGNLVVNSIQQEMYIYNTIPLNDFSWQDFPHVDNNYLVKNATIIVNNTDNISYRYTLVLDTSVYYYASKFNIKPLNSYTIKIIVGGDELNGETHTPGDFPIISPLSNQHFTQINDTIKIPLIWNASPNSYGYIINIFHKYGTRFSREASFVSQDTSFVYVINERGRTKYKFEVLAFDKNFYEHIIQKVPNAGIEGAYGYFGSSVLKSVTVGIN